MTKLINMHGRQVMLSPIPEEVTRKPESFCHDCGGVPSALVTEISKLNETWNPTKVPAPVISWFWCQKCDIGG